MSQGIITMLYRILVQLQAGGGALTNIAGITRVMAFSTTTPLAAGGVYTSPVIDTINYTVSLRGRLFTDQNGSYVLYHSDDGITFDPSVPVAYTGVATVGALNLTTLSKYIKIVYTNGSTIQTVFHLSMYLSPI